MPLGGSILRLTQHDCVDDEPHDVLQDQDSDGCKTVFSDHSPSEAYGDLDLDGEQES